MNNVASLKALYIALGGSSADVAEASTTVDVLNATAVLRGGNGDAVTNAEAIDNITATFD